MAGSIDSRCEGVISARHRGSSKAPRLASFERRVPAKSTPIGSTSSSGHAARTRTELDHALQSPRAQVQLHPSAAFGFDPSRTSDSNSRREMPRGWVTRHVGSRHSSTYHDAGESSFTTWHMNAARSSSGRPPPSQATTRCGANASILRRVFVELGSSTCSAPRMEVDASSRPSIAVKESWRTTRAGTKGGGASRSSGRAIPSAPRTLPANRCHLGPKWPSMRTIVS